MTQEIKIILAISDSEASKKVYEMIESQNGLTIAAEAFNPVETLMLMAETEADLVMLDLPDTNEDPGICSHLLAEFPQLVIIALSSNCQEAILYRHNISKTRIKDASDKQILALIRQIKEEEKD